MGEVVEKDKDVNIDRRHWKEAGKAV